MKNISLLRWLGPLLIGLCLWHPAQAQERKAFNCGTPDLNPAQTKAFANYIKQAELRRKQVRTEANGITYLGIKPWLASGSTYWSAPAIVYQVNRLNQDFFNTKIQFFIVSGGIGAITATTSNTLTYPNDESNLLATNFDATAINVYFTDVLNNCGSNSCKQAGGLSPSLYDLNTLTDRATDVTNPNVQAKKDDYILIGNAYSDVLSHEMGHYFGLLHTFNGSDAANCQDRERPNLGDTDRGDLIADTNADPYPLYPATTFPFNQTTCVYSGTLVHCATNQAFNPPLFNTMSYWDSDLCTKQFTSNQKSRIQLFLSPRLEANNQYHPQNGVEGVTVGPTVALAVSGTNRQVNVSALSGSLGYILETATDATFSNPLIIGITSLTASQSFQDNDVPPPGTTYYYRVRATNSKTYSRVLSYPCTPPTATLSGSQTITNGQSATYTVALTGSPPWDVQVGGQTYTNVATSPLKIVTAPFQALQQTYTQITSGGSVTNTCGTAPMSGTASVTVLGTCPTVSVTLVYGSIGCGSTTTSGTIFTSPTGYALSWRNVTTGTDYPGASTTAYNLTAGEYTIDLTGPNGCTGPQQRFTIRDYGPNGSTATLSGPVNNRIPRGQQTSIRVELTGTAPWSVTYTGRSNRQFVASAITTSSYDIPVLADSTTTYRLVAVSGQCSTSALSGSATLLVVPVLASLEYFVDSDPGLGQATPVAVGFNQTTTNQTIAVPIGLSGALATPGVHLLGVRAKDASGYWSPASLKPFVIFGQTPTNTSPITDVVYQLDGGPVTGRQVSLTSNQAVTLPVSISLTPGVHLLTARVYSNRGVFSEAISRPFVVFGTSSSSSSAITQAEYYVDTDPGVGVAASLAFTPVPGVPYALSINIGSITPGTHTLVIRTKDGSKRWSTSYVRSFMVNQDARGISRVEYFFDSADPGVGNGQPFTLSAPASASVTGSATSGTSSLSVGTHSVQARAQAGGIEWGVTKAASFTVTNCATAAAFLYGSSTITAGQSVVVSVGLGGSAPYSLTANGQVQTNLTTGATTFSLTLSTPGTFTLTPQSIGLAVANACGAGQVSGSAVVTVLPGAACASMQTVKAGSWDDPAVWSCGRIPLVSDPILIGHAITLPTGYVAHVRKISFAVNGKASYSTNARLLMGF